MLSDLADTFVHASRTPERPNRDGHPTAQVLRNLPHAYANAADGNSVRRMLPRLGL